MRLKLGYRRDKLDMPLGNFPSHRNPHGTGKQLKSMQPNKNNILHFIYRATQYFQIPDFQRPYTWDSSIVEAFLHDLEHALESSRNHYFGTLVYVPEADHFTVIDGQQRLTTSLLLLVAIYHILREHPEKSQMTAQQVRDQYLYDQYGAPDKDRKILLRTVTTDNEVFKKLFEGQSLTIDEAANRQKKTYDQFFRYFLQRDQLERYIRALERFEIITVAIDKNDDNPQLIFESINSTGAPLSSGDKIRNYSLMLNSEWARSHVYDRYWSHIERSLTRREGNALVDDITGFYRHFLQCKAEESFAEAQTYSRFKIFFNQSAGTGHAIEQLNDYYGDLLEFMKAYLFIEYGDDPDGLFAAFSEFNFRFQFLEFSPRISFLMDILVGHVRGLISEQEVIGIYKALEVFIVRRLMCNMGTQSLNKSAPAWFKQLQHLRQSCPESSLDDIFRRFILDGRGRTRVFPNDAEVRNAVSNYPMGTYVNRNINYFLSCIEDSIQPNESRLLSQIRRRDIQLTIEHIMPQMLSGAWRRELGESAETIHETWLNRLANLTLTGYNSSYSNRSFAEKLSCENGFSKSPLNINRHIAEYQVWNEDSLKQRQAWLIDRILSTWPSLTSSVRSGSDSRPGRLVIGDEIDITYKKPVLVEICGTTFPVSTWRQLAETVWKQLFQLDSGLFETFLIDPDFALRGGGRQVTSEGNSLRNPSPIAPGVFVEVHYSATDLRELIIKIAAKFQLEDDIFYELGG